MAEETEPENPDAPTIDEFGLDVPMGTSFYVVSPDGLDEQLRDEMVTALEELVASDEWADTLESVGLSDSGLNHADTQDEIDSLIDEYEVLEP